MGKTNYVKKNDEKKKNNIMNIGIVLVVAIIIGALAIMVSNNKGLNGKNRIIEVNYAEYLERIKNENYTVVLLAAPDCSHCQNYKPFVKGLADEYDFDVYYLNVHSEKLTNEEYDKIHDSISATKNEFTSDGETVIPTPTTVIFKNGGEVASVLGDIGYDGLKSFLTSNGVIKDVK